MDDLDLHVELLSTDSVLGGSVDSDLIGLILSHINISQRTECSLDLNNSIFPNELSLLFCYLEVVKESGSLCGKSGVPPWEVNGRLLFALGALAFPILSVVLETPVFVAVGTGGVDDDHWLLNVLDVFDDDLVGDCTLTGITADSYVDGGVPFLPLGVGVGTEMPLIILGVMDIETIVFEVGIAGGLDVGDGDGTKYLHVTVGLGVVQVLASNPEVEGILSRDGSLVIELEVLSEEGY